VVEWYWQGEREHASYDLDIANKQFANNSSKMDIRLNSSKTFLIHFHTSSWYWEHCVISNDNFKLTLILKAKSVLLFTTFPLKHHTLNLNHCIFASGLVMKVLVVQGKERNSFCLGEVHGGPLS